VADLSQNLLRRHPERARLPDVEAQPRPSTAVAIEGEQGILVQDIADVGCNRKAVLPFHAGAQEVPARKAVLLKSSGFQRRAIRLSIVVAPNNTSSLERQTGQSFRIDGNRAPLARR
jgi:hypothetical protein